MLQKSKSPTKNQATCVVGVPEEDWLLAAQQHDNYKTLSTFWRQEIFSQLKKIFNNYSLKSGKVFKITHYWLRWVATKFVRFQIMRMTHDDVGQFGFEKTCELSFSHYWFKNIRRFTKKYVKIAC